MNARPCVDFLSTADNDGPNYARTPAMPRFDEEVVLGLAMAANFCERHAQAVRTNAPCFGQDLVKVAFPESEAAKFRKLSLLTQEIRNRARSAHLNDA
jgi:hypothetical protein